MALPFQYTYSRNATLAKLKHQANAAVTDIRLTGVRGNMNVDQPWITLRDAIGGADNATMPTYGSIPLDTFSSTCFYFGEALYEGLSEQHRVPLGLIHTAYGGSMIEQWLTNDDIANCKGATIKCDPCPTAPLRRYD